MKKNHLYLICYFTFYFGCKYARYTQCIKERIRKPMKNACNLSRGENLIRVLIANSGSKSTENLPEIMERLNKQEKITFIFSIHDQRLVNKARRAITTLEGKTISDIKK